jgi:hypothetical protein
MRGSVRYAQHTRQTRTDNIGERPRAPSIGGAGGDWSETANSLASWSGGLSGAKATVYALKLLVFNASNGADQMIAASREDSDEPDLRFQRAGGPGHGRRQRHGAGDGADVRRERRLRRAG